MARLPWLPRRKKSISCASEVEAQRKTIEELKALVEKLANASARAAAAPQASDGSSASIQPVVDRIVPRPVSAPNDFGARLLPAVLLEPTPMPEAMIDQAASAQKKEPPLTAGWNGEHFFIRSPDGQFSISPYGYVDTDYRAYKGDGAPSDTFLLRRARFGFQGNYGSHFDFALLTDAVRALRFGRARRLSQRKSSGPSSNFRRASSKTPFAPGNRNRRHQPGFRRTRLSVRCCIPRRPQRSAAPASLFMAILTVASCSTG